MHPESLPSQALFSASRGNPGETCPWGTRQQGLCICHQQVGELRGDAPKLASPDLASSRPAACRDPGDLMVRTWADEHMV